MRKFMFIMALSAPLLGAEAQDSTTTSEIGFYTQFVKPRGEKLVPRVFVQGYQYFASRPSCGFWGFAYGEKKYLSNTLGLFCDPRDWLSLGVAVGGESFVPEDREVNAVFGRYAFTGWLGTETTNLEIYFENGPSKTPWHRADLQLWGNDFVSLGGISQTSDGFGPRLRLALPLWQNEVGKRVDFRLWVAPMYSSFSSLKQRPKGLLLGGEIVGRLRELASP